MIPTLSLRNVKKTYNERTALQVEHLDFYAGTVYSLVGPNGAGKSTLLELMALLQPPCRGDIEFKGEMVRWGSTEARRARRRVTLVQQTPYLLNCTVYDNIAFGLHLRGIRDCLQRSKVAEVLGAVGLASFHTRKAWELSGGETQRVAIARALALDPDVLLLDEPTSSICKDTTAIVEEVIETLAEKNKTVILSTHDPAQPQRLNSQTVYLHGGRVLNPPTVNNILRVPDQPGAARAACG